MPFLRSIPALTLSLFGACCAPLTAQERILELAPPGDRCEIVPEELAVLGGGSDEFAIDQTASVARDARGRYFVAGNVFNPGVVAVYDSRGEFQRTLGRPGDGPGEFGWISAVRPGPGDSIFVWTDARVAVFTPAELDLARTARLPGRAQDALRLPDGSMVVTGSAPGAPGLPAHLLSDDGGVIESFGVDPGDADVPSGPLSSRRSLAQDGSGRVWLARTNAYVAELWDPRGQRLQRLLRDVEWFREQPYSARQGWDEPPRASAGGVRVDPQGRLWVSISVPSADWVPRARPASEGVESTAETFDPSRRERDRDRIIEVLDPATGRVVGHHRFDEAYRIGWLPHPYMYRIFEGEDLFIRLQIVRMTCGGGR